MDTNQQENSSEAVQLQQELPRDVLEVRENTAATWSYHIAHEDTPNEALCGKKVMGTGLGLEDWGNTSPAHLHISFCDKCERRAIQKAREGAW